MSWWERLVGTRERLGWWTLPVFVAVGLLGAVLAGSLAVIYYGQQVDELSESTRAARAAADEAREEIQRTAEEALEQIREQVDAVRESLTTEFPVSSGADIGVALVRAFPGPPPPSPSPEPTSQPTTQPTSETTSEPTAGPTGGASPSPGPEGSPTAQAEVGRLQEGEPTPPPPPNPEPAPRGQPATGSAFPVVRQATTTFYATTFAVIEDPHRPGQPVDDIELSTANGTVRAGVHSFDRALDLALLRAEVGEIEIPEWRPADEPVDPGDKLWAVGLTPTLSTAQVGGTVVLAEPRAIVSDMTLLNPLRGGPLVDLEGRIVGVVSSAYRPFGAGPDAAPAALPIRVLCEGLLRCDPEGAAGG